MRNPPIAEFARLVDGGEYLRAAQWLRGVADTLPLVGDSLVVRGAQLTPQELRDAAEQETDGAAVFSLASAIWAQDGAELFGLDVLAAAAPMSNEGAAAYGEALHWFGNEEQALPWLRHAVTGNDSSFLRGLLGEVCLALGLIDEAISNLEVAASERTMFGVPLAEALLSGATVRAEELLRELTEVEEYGAAILLGNMLKSRGDEVGAEHALRAGELTGDAYSSYNLGTLYEMQGRQSEALSAYARARAGGDLRVTPGEWRALNASED